MTIAGIGGHKICDSCRREFNESEEAIVLCEDADRDEARAARALAVINSGGSNYIDEHKMAVEAVLRGHRARRAFVKKWLATPAAPTSTTEPTP